MADGHLEIFRHGPVIIYTRLPAGGTYYPVCMFPASSECFDRHFWCLFCLLFTGIRHLPHLLTVPPTKACLLCATPVGMDLYIQVHARRLLPSAVPWISEDRLLRAKSTEEFSFKLTDIQFNSIQFKKKKKINYPTRGNSVVVMTAYAEAERAPCCMSQLQI